MVAQLVAESGRPPSDFLVLYRANSQSRALEEWMRRLSIPYCIVGGIRFYERQEVKDIVAYLRILVNPNDFVSLRRAISNPPRGIGPKTLEKLEIHSGNSGETLLDLIGHPEDVQGLGPSVQGKLRAFHELLVRIEGLKEEPVPNLIMGVIEEVGYFDYLDSKFDTWEADRKRGNLKELVESAQEFIGETGGTLLDYLSFVSLRTDVDDWDEPLGYVTLMTVHNAKGVEYPVVIITGLEEGTFPHHLTLESSIESEEERRLFHVALTRAMKEAYLSRSMFRAVRGRAPLLPSRFLDEVPKDCLGEERKAEGMDDEFSPGDIVYHSLFGRGEVVSTGDDKVKVRFNVGLKTLVPRYARLKRA
jgi:DNA helicase-2/ATP-dependent DNA helicase PcrA